MDYALNQGINFFDAAEMYPSPSRKETYGETEKNYWTIGLVKEKIEIKLF